MNDFFTQTTTQRSLLSSLSHLTYVGLLASSLLLTACSDSENTPTFINTADNSPALGDDPADSADTGRDDERGGQQLTASGCDTAGNLLLDGLLGLSVPASTRADATADLLALESSNAVVADQALYLRVSAELAALRSAFPDRSNVAAIPCYPGRIFATLGDSFASTTLFDAYNTLLRTQLALLGDGKSIIISVAGVYDMQALAGQYDALPNIEFATTDDAAADGDDICLEKLANNSHLYIFDQTAGDCTADCTVHNLSGFIVDVDGNTTDLGSFQQQPGAAEPIWYQQAISCRSYL